MTRRKLEGLRRELAAFRKQGGIKSSEMEAFAKRCGRYRSKRGSEPTWVSDDPGTRPLSIPHHSVDLNRYTAGSMLDHLEADLDRIEVQIDQQETEEEDDPS